MALRRGRRPLYGRGTTGLAIVAGISSLAVIGNEVARVWRRGSAPLPTETPHVLGAAEEAVAETVTVAVAGYQRASERENALLNLFSSFVITFLSARGIAYLLRGRSRLGPFRDLFLGRRHIHHFVPGILLTFGAGSVAIATGSERLKPKLALAFGTGMGLTLDESALLLELDDVYWRREGVVSVQITLAVTALLASLVLALRLLRRGEAAVLPDA